jgi:hypothetical protein
MRPAQSPYLTIGQVALEQRRESFKVDAVSLGQLRRLFTHQSIKRDHALTDFANIPRGQPRPCGALVPLLRRRILHTSTHSIEFTVSLLSGEITPHTALVAVMVQRGDQCGEGMNTDSECLEELVALSHVVDHWSHHDHHRRFGLYAEANDYE